MVVVRLSVRIGALFVTKVTKVSKVSNVSNVSIVKNKKNSELLDNYCYKK